mgnify:CR=1 FL=1
MIRLDKYLSEMGAGTRQEVKQYIRKGRVMVDGETALRPEMKVDETKVCVTLDEHKIGYASYVYYMMNKPAGVVSATEDKKEKTVIDLIEGQKRKDLFPVGRLDKDTVGLLLITNDGALAHRLLSPKHHVDKCYFAKVQGKVTKEDIHAFEKGVDIGTPEEPEMTMPAKLEIINSDEISEIRLTIQEGKFHQVKRMFQAVGKEVIYLKRERMGSLCLDESLEEGGYRMLTEEELKNYEVL